MESVTEESVPVSSSCEMCDAVGSHRCGHCRVACYCSRGHQVQHWPLHKKVCKASLLSGRSVPSTNSESASISTSSSRHVINACDAQRATLNVLCPILVRDMNKCGICVLDNFMGASFANLILQEVKSLYTSGNFEKGAILNPNFDQFKESIRSDVITWVTGTERKCKSIGNMMKKVNAIVSTCNNMRNSGLFSKYKLGKHTKAMIACYPGDGTHYKKHIDNPLKDGRCITCIYYPNKDWDVTKHGGQLRLYPAADNSRVADIAPIFDRMVFFWSDKRNPHEVLPTFANRFAITVWIFDTDERDQALKSVKSSPTSVQESAS